MILGRGSFTESFPLFGYDLADYDVLFEEKLDLFVKLLDEQPVSWSGSTRAPLENAEVFPRPSPGRLPTWVGVGGSPQSVVRAARYGLPLMLAIIGGSPERFAPYVDLYRRAAEQFGTTAHPVGMHSPGFIADSDEEAVETFYSRYKLQRDRIGALPGGWPPLRRAGVRRGGRDRIALRRLAGDGRTQDRQRGQSARRRTLRPDLHRRLAADRRPHARGRAVRQQRHPHGARAARRAGRLAAAPRGAEET